MKQDMDIVKSQSGNNSDSYDIFPEISIILMDITISFFV